ncbi:carbohydrate-binding module family 1 protein [Lophiostoma macrostomum CBS 122681]|uniref:Carbohydrate-binding module family 1 protein n=1 Tax=Lophiostoma macrostomum CBS 122681 TaxID=1314788 RepID=A0A6A6THQ1_9PLEO|nr:carbohydrate-binding module family 1 protein [Lophiostoma macrostomum CBS 122681]
MLHISATLVAVLAGTASAVLSDWQQCGGSSWTGETACASGSGCVKVNEYYSQCQPGAAAPSATAAPAPSEVLSDTPGPSATGTPAGTGPGTTLQSGYYWIRAVEAPNFHKYLQSKPLYATGPAILGDYTTAGQFQVVDGQLVQLVSAPGASPVTLLYGIVSVERYFNNLSLSVTWSATKNTYGTFGWQGDGLTWSEPSIQRPNAIAWYVCSGQTVYINIGNYLYGTPSGCADETIHYYNDKTANN